MKRFLALWILTAAGVIFVATDPFFTVIDDETAIVNVADLPLRDLLLPYAEGQGRHEHPPLYDALLHGWLIVSHHDSGLVRLPSVLFFLAGAWLLAESSLCLAGAGGFWSGLCATLLWPFGIHYGRYAAWYSLSFFCLTWLTYGYIELLRQPTLFRWLSVVLAGTSLLYTTYFAWVIIALLAMDFALANRLKIRLWLLAATLVLLVLLYAPLWLATLNEVKIGVAFPHDIAHFVIYPVFNLYSLFVSESVAPWFFLLSVPAAVAILVCFNCVLLRTHAVSRRLLVYFCSVFALMSLLGIINTKRLLMIAPWLLLPLCAAAAPSISTRWRTLLIVSMGVAAAVGWFGIINRDYYSAPRLVEPWRTVAHQAAAQFNSGATLVSNSPSFFFYLHDAIGDNRVSQDWPNTLQAPRVFDVREWVEIKHSSAFRLYFVKGVSISLEEATHQTEAWIESHCQLEGKTRLVKDVGFALKRKLFPGAGQEPWRIETSSYSCIGKPN